MDTTAADLWSHTLAEYELTPPREELVHCERLGASTAVAVSNARQPTRDNWPAAPMPSLRVRELDARAAGFVDEAAGNVLEALWVLAGDDPRRAELQRAYDALAALLPLLAPECVDGVVLEEES